MHSWSAPVRRWAARLLSRRPSFPSPSPRAWSRCSAQSQVHGPNGAAIATGKPHVAPDSNRRLTVTLPKLPPGTYTVNWHVTSVDTHKTEGNYTFTVTH